jgi:hypothetical protein
MTAIILRSMVHRQPCCSVATRNVRCCGIPENIARFGYLTRDIMIEAGSGQDAVPHRPATKQGLALYCDVGWAKARERLRSCGNAFARLCPRGTNAYLRAHEHCSVDAWATVKPPLPTLQVSAPRCVLRFFSIGNRAKWATRNPLTPPARQRGRPRKAASVSALSLSRPFSK